MESDLRVIYTKLCRNNHTVSILTWLSNARLRNQPGFSEKINVVVIE